MTKLELVGAIKILDNAMEHVYNAYPSECDNGCEVCDAAQILNLACLEIELDIAKGNYQ